MESFDGSRRREGRSPLPPGDRRSLRDPEALEQRLDRWMSTGRQLVEGVSGGRPGARAGGRRAEGRPGIDGLGRWVEDRLDWLLDDGEDWREPWQESERDRREPPAAPNPRQARPELAPREPLAEMRRPAVPRRPLEAISRRGMAGAATGAGASPSRRDSSDDWPDDEAFSVPRWQRPSAPLRRPDPLQTEREERQGDPASDAPPPPPARPLPRSSRRR